MPGFNELGRGKLAISLAKLLNVNDQGALRSLAPELSGVVQLPIAEEELMGAAGLWQRWSSGFRTTAVAAEQNRYCIRNPAGSGTLLFLEAVYFSALAAGHWSADSGYVQSSDYSTFPNIEFRDGRQNPRAGAAARVSYQTQGGGDLGATGWAEYTSLGIVAIYRPCPILLLPGNGILFGFATVNTVTAATFCWRERGATPGELAF